MTVFFSEALQRSEGRISFNVNLSLLGDGYCIFFLAMEKPFVTLLLCSSYFFICNLRFVFSQ